MPTLHVPDPFWAEPKGNRSNFAAGWLATYKFEEVKAGADAGSYQGQLTQTAAQSLLAEQDPAIPRGFGSATDPVLPAEPVEIVLKPDGQIVGGAEIVALVANSAAGSTGDIPEALADLKGSAANKVQNALAALTPGGRTLVCVVRIEG